MHAARIELLQRMPVFGAIRDDALQFLLEQAPTVVVAARQFFFREGEAPTGMFVLETGRVAVSKDWRGKEYVMRYLSKGDCFGEMALMDLQPRSASVRAVEDCSAIELTPANLYRLFELDTEQFAMIQMNMGREVCRRLRMADEVLFRARMESGNDDTIIRTNS
jgi:CRP-like cAMP-binding protein